MVTGKRGRKVGRGTKLKRKGISKSRNKGIRMAKSRKEKDGVELRSPKVKMIPVYLPSQPKSAPHSRLRAILEPLQSHWHFVEVRSRGGAVRSCLRSRERMP